MKFICMMYLIFEKMREKDILGHFFILFKYLNNTYMYFFSPGAGFIHSMIFFSSSPYTKAPAKHPRSIYSAMLNFVLLLDLISFKKNYHTEGKTIL